MGKELLRRAPEQVTSENAAEWALKYLGYELDENQKSVLASEHDRVIVNCSRQWGKSFTAPMKATHHAWTKPESVTLVLTPSKRQSRLFVSKVRGHLRRLGVQARGDGENEISVLFPNGAQVIGLPGNEATVRGFTASLLLVDEAAKVSEKLYDAVKPALATTNGPVWLMSTPYGKRGFFHREWARAGEDWVKVRVPATDCPRISRAFLERERREMSDRMFRQEYLCEFSAAEDGTFDPDLIDDALNGAVEPLDL